MTWFPMGPDFVFTARNGNYKRLTRKNELGRQGLAKCIAVDQTDPSTIYVVDRPSSGGTAAFRTEDGGKSWKCISDSLHQSDPLIDPQCPPKTKTPLCQQERKFVKLLTEADGYKAREGELKLFKGSTDIMAFELEALASNTE